MRWRRSTENCNRGKWFFPPSLPDISQTAGRVDWVLTVVMQRSRAYLLRKNSSTDTLRVIFANFTALKLSQIQREILIFFASSQHLLRGRNGLIDLTEVGRGLSVSEGGKWNIAKASFLRFKRTYSEIQSGINEQLYEMTLGRNDMTVSDHMVLKIPLSSPEIWAWSTFTKWPAGHNHGQKHPTSGFQKQGVREGEDFLLWATLFLSQTEQLHLDGSSFLTLSQVNVFHTHFS